MNPQKLKKERIALFVLFLITGIWGSTFVVVKDAGLSLSPWALNAWRFLIGSIVLGTLCVLRRSPVSKQTIIQGSFLGLLLFLAFALQTFGLKYTTATNSAFLTGWNALMVPAVTYILFKHKISLQTWGGIGCALLGSWLLLSDASIKFNVGDTLTLGCAFIFALHICFLSEVTKKNDLYALSFIQIASCGVYFFVTALVSEPGLMRETAAQYLPSLLYLGLFATVLTFTFQTYIQQFVEAPKVALVFATEPLWGAIFAWLFLQEKIPAIGYFGGVLMVLGIVVAEWNFRTRRRRQS